MDVCVPLCSAVQRSSPEDPREALKFGRKGTNRFHGQKELGGRSLSYATLALSNLNKRATLADLLTRRHLLEDDTIIRLRNNGESGCYTTLGNSIS